MGGTYRGLVAALIAIGIASGQGEALARSHVVGPGDSLWRIARAHRCEVDALRRANRLEGTMIRRGQKLNIPSCGGQRPAKRVALRSEKRAPGMQSIGRPQGGRLINASALPANPRAYHIRRPHRAFGTRSTVDQVVRAIQRVRRRHPRVHPLAIGDLSARRGGKITMHGSHQSGRDVDLGFYFRGRPRGYPAAFVVADQDNLDFAASWTLLVALAENAGRPGGVERIYMSYRTQELFYRLGLEHGVPESSLGHMFQYPHGEEADHGLVRHEPEHDEHIHVRFACPRRDSHCR
jgi:hypothetical protein